MPEHTVLVGVVLLAVVPFIAWDTVSSLRAGFDNAFWALPLEEKLPRIAEQPAAWRRLGTTWIYVVVLMTAGFTAFGFQLGAAGEPVLAALGLGAVLVGALGFVIGVLPMTTTVAAAAVVKRETSTSPGWLKPMWDSFGMMERTFVIAANLAYAAWGVAIVDSGFPAEWAGWVAFVSGLLLAVWAAAQDYFFQHMTLITPLVVGVALLLA